MAPRKRKLNINNMTAKQRRAAQANRDNSPFLRLPGEIRNIIYGHVLGGKKLRQTRTGPNWRSPKTKFLPPCTDNDRQEPQTPPDQINWLSLLSTCREIYNDTRLLPSKLNVLSVTHKRHIFPLLEKLDLERRMQITAIQLEVAFGVQSSHTIWVSPWFDWLGLPDLRRLSSLLPSVNNIEVVTFGSDDRDPNSALNNVSVPTEQDFGRLENILTSINGWVNAQVTSSALSHGIFSHRMS